MPSDHDQERRVPSGAHQPMEFDAELLAEYLGRELTREPGNSIWRDERFIEWLALEAREEYEHSHRISDVEFRRRGQELMLRVHAKKVRVAAGRAAPIVERCPGTGVGQERPRPVASGPVPVVELGIAAGVGRELWDEPVSSWVELPDGVPSGEYVALKITGDSMSPLMHTGDTVLVRIGSHVQRDTVIVARHPDDGYVCKRVSRLRRTTIELSSLQPGRPLITIPRDPACIVGTVILVWCHHRH